MFEVNPETGKSGELEFHAEAAERFDRILQKIRQPVTDGVHDVVGKLGLESELLTFDEQLPEIDRYVREQFLKEGNGPCCQAFRVPGPNSPALHVVGPVGEGSNVSVCQNFRVPGPDSPVLRLCFRGLPTEETVAKLQEALTVLFNRIPLEGG